MRERDRRIAVVQAMVLGIVHAALVIIVMAMIATGAYKELGAIIAIYTAIVAIVASFCGGTIISEHEVNTRFLRCFGAVVMYLHVVIFSTMWVVEQNVPDAERVCIGLWIAAAFAFIATVTFGFSLGEYYIRGGDDESSGNGD